MQRLQHGYCHGYSASRPRLPERTPIPRRRRACGALHARTEDPRRSPPSNKHAPFRRLFNSLDIDGDGIVLREELLAAAQGSLGSALARAFNTLDDSADGTLTWEEFAEPAWCRQYYTAE
ncbi:EF-hand domain-containing protein [Sorangium sp. So ce1128]